MYGQRREGRELKMLRSLSSEAHLSQREEEPWLLESLMAAAAQAEQELGEGAACLSASACEARAPLSSV